MLERTSAARLSSASSHGRLGAPGDMADLTDLTSASRLSSASSHGRMGAPGGGFEDGREREGEEEFVIAEDITAICQHQVLR